MALPVGQLAKSTVEVNGESVPIRSLSRTEAMRIKAISEDLDETEVHILMCGTDSTREEVDAFRASSDAGCVDVLVEAIARLSGIMPQENGSGPKA